MRGNNFKIVIILKLISALKDNAHYLNSPMEFNKNGYTCCLDTTKHDEMEKSRGHHAHYVTTAHYIITRFYSFFFYDSHPIGSINNNGTSLSVLLLVYVYISYWTMARKSISVYVVAYEKGYMYNFDIEKNHVLRFIDGLKKN